MPLNYGPGNVVWDHNFYRSGDVIASMGLVHEHIEEYKYFFDRAFLNGITDNFDISNPHQGGFALTIYPFTKIGTQPKAQRMRDQQKGAARTLGSRT